MKTRTSRRNQDRLWRILATDGSVPPKIKVVADIRYLSMTDSEIDQAYMVCGKADRTRMKKAAAKERLRLQVQSILAQEHQAQA